MAPPPAIPPAAEIKRSRKSITNPNKSP